MVSKGLLKATESMDLVYVDRLPIESSYLYGVYNGYLISLYDNGKHKSVFVNYYLDIDEEDSDSIQLMNLSQQLKDILQMQIITDLSVESNGLLYTIACGFDEFIQLLDKVLEMLKKNDVVGTSRCSSCGNILGKRYPKRITKNKNNYLVCDHCALDTLESSKSAQAEEPKRKSRTGLGLLGALAGGILGAFLFFALYKWVCPLIEGTGFDFRYIFTICGLATAYLVYKGFTLLSKKACASEAVIVSVFSLLFTAFGQYLGSFAYYAELQGFRFFDALRIPSMWLIHLRSTVDTTLVTDQTILDNYHVSPMFYRLLFISLLFALIGTILFQVGFFEKAKPKKTQIEVETYKGPRENKPVEKDRLPDAEPNAEPDPAESEQADSEA